MRFKATILGLVGLAGLLYACAPASASEQDCWNIAYGAIRHRAAAPHPPYITYDETLQIIRDGMPFMQSRASVMYRDDGVLRVSDDRFMDRPFVTTFAEPGPPELGPYGDRRSAWLPVQDAAYNVPLIGEVRANNHSGLTCTNEGVESYKDHTTYHLAFTTTRPDRPSLKALWIDTKTSEIWKVVLSGFVPVGVNTKADVRMTDFEVELEQLGPYLVVDHVTWKYRFREYDQFEELFGEYYYTRFEFPRDLPATLFEA